ncbi:MAG TPA: CRISPR-associated helicase Cas3' [Candidatus Paceibacterota bacterium]|nr:CRISPR-associated helicase Cas3' [Verrucomicrobiota bacterium]HRY49785.1 CRISPR-associated helicase Cas3' [Candidatus Paceibacterota bacterium]
MDPDNIHFWAKTTKNAEGIDMPGISVYDHCLNVGCVAEALIAALPPRVQALLPPGAVTLAALHDIGKITLGFQAKCPMWLEDDRLPKFSPGEIVLSVSDHALVSQVFLQNSLQPAPARLWAAAVGAHHGRPKGRTAQLPKSTPEALAKWAELHRGKLARELISLFGALPDLPPDPRFVPHHSDLWLLAGLITVADWIGSNETWFSPKRGLPQEVARQQARSALVRIGWPGGRLKQTDFATAFFAGQQTPFIPNPLQQAVVEAAQAPGVIIIEGPMGCGKTEAALFAAQQWIAVGPNHGIYFALPTQVTSNRIHKRVEQFLRNTLVDEAPLRLAHGNAWLEDDFDLRLRPTFHWRSDRSSDDPAESVRESRSWFASAKQALLATYGVGTIDQALQAVVAVKHFFVRRFALAGKVVILDEVHSYDIYTGTLVAALIRELVNLRCSVVVLSATLTAARRRELLKGAGVIETDSPQTYPLITTGVNGNARHFAPDWKSKRRIALRPAVIPEAETVAELVRRAEAGQQVLWIRNTVIEAQEAFREACCSARECLVRVGLLHSRFPFQRRAQLEDDWLERLGKNRPADGPGSILIATQVVEQSVDIDLDFIISDLAPTDMLLQRLGRLWRHERPHRPTSQPEFWIRLPELPANADAGALKKSFGRSARVYAPYVLLRTMDVWQSQTEINLPADIRPLLEATYAEPDKNEADAWREVHAELETEKATLAANAAAATRVLGNPVLADKEEILTRRKGPPTTPVILLRSITGGLNGLTTLAALDGSRVEISEHEWRRAHARFLLEWMVRAPHWMVPANAPRPRWLDLHGPSDAVVAVVRDDGRCLFGEDVSPMTYDPRLGLFAERAPQPAPQTWKDDDDEFDY